MDPVYEKVDPHERKDPGHKTLDTMKNVASGSAIQAAIYLGVSVLALLGAVGTELMTAIYGTADWTVGALFLVWLSGTTFTLGILEYRRSQQPHGMYHGPEV